MKATLSKTFLPWLCYAGLCFCGFVNGAAPAALLVLMAGCVLSGAKPVDLVLGGYFAVVSFGVGILHWDRLASIQPVMAPGMLAAMAFVTVLLRRPFTLPYARESVKDPVILASPHFYRVNAILSVLWGAAFLAAALGQAWALGRPEWRWTATAGGGLATGTAALFTWWFPRWYHRRFYEPEAGGAEVAG